MFDEPVSRRLTTGLSRIATAIRSQAWDQAGRHRLTPTQAMTMRLLAGRPTGLRIGELADRLGVTAQTASDSAATLVRKDLVRKTPDPADRRIVRLTLTDAGAAAAEELAEWPDALLDTVAELDPEEQRLLLRIVVKLIRGLQERGQMPVAKVCVTCRFFAPYAHPDSPRPHHCRFVDAPFGATELQTDCNDHEPAGSAAGAALWRRFQAPPAG